MKKLFIILLLSVPVYGQDNPFTDGELAVSVAMSKHSDGNYDYESKHLVLGYYHEKSKLFGAVITPNSYGDVAITTGLLGRSGWFGWYNLFQTEIYGGVVYGYGDNLYPSFAGLSFYGWLGLGVKTPFKGLEGRARVAPGVYTLGLDYTF